MMERLTLIVLFINVCTALCNQDRPVVLDISKDSNPGIAVSRKTLPSGVKVVAFESQEDKPIRKVISSTLLVWGSFSNVNSCQSVCVYLEEEETRALELTFKDTQGVKQNEKFVYVNNGWLKVTDDMFTSVINEIKVPSRKQGDDKDAGTFARWASLVIFPATLAIYLYMQ
ncbi:uncharacterized protein BEWA_033790 [Theileria equi strain WA]|uniref:Membrane protein, putative n=1 Tax=Theileria equi strain WA TaxID=1537102 RepID=L0B066_THEEQ|nr:uncharacterized protein BEWA_033790 [Theileria equi strain WA]AFZ80524.1 membrane protein, putative [Theileria equi strain WA]|eukprot:XP_004830190.1 uncharacterized protein BEWA_033790 [Theileria equi strain WA]